MNVQVLLVDDDEMVIFLHKTMARMSGLAADPLCFGDGKAALEYLTARYQEGCHYLVLLDVNMPTMNGWEFLRAVQTTKFADALTVIMITSSSEQEDQDQARQFKQVITFMEKPLSVPTCRQILHLPELKARIKNNAQPKNSSS